jgi:hypothetical protein
MARTRPPLHQPPYRGLSPRPAQQPPPSYNPPGFLSQPITFQSSHQNAWGPYPAGIPLPASSFPHSISYPHQAPYQAQYQIPPHRASVPAAPTCTRGQQCSANAATLLLAHPVGRLPSPPLSPPSSRSRLPSPPYSIPAMTQP